MEGTVTSNAKGRHRRLYRRGWLTTVRSVVVVALALPLTIGSAWAGEDSFATAPTAHPIVIVDSGLLYPGTLTVHRGDSLAFQNYSSEPVMFTFIEPKNAADELRCRIAGNTDPTAGRGKVERWPLLTTGASHDLTITIPPGRSSSMCSLAAGRYVFVTKRIERDPRSSVDTLGYKGIISVE
jgi:hypothetical protein